MGDIVSIILLVAVLGVFFSCAARACCPVEDRIRRRVAPVR